MSGSDFIWRIPVGICYFLIHLCIQYIDQPARKVKCLDPRRFSHVDMVRGIRSPGSTLKPFLYAMALDDGLIHSESLLADTPQSFSGYDPGNFQASFSGPVSVSEALQRSLNVPAVDLLDRIGSTRFTARLASAGLRLRLPRDGEPNLSIILVSPPQTPTYPNPKKSPKLSLFKMSRSGDARARMDCAFKCV